MAENDQIRVVKTVPALVFTALLVIVSVVAIVRWNAGDGPPGSFGEFQISGASMADALAGEHFAVRCGDCGFLFRCDAANPPHDELAVCPNCGYAENRLKQEIFRVGDTVSVEPFRDNDPPKRWEIAAFQSPDDDGQLSVKRIVGLPGEKVEIRDGDVLINGTVERKSLAQLRKMAIVIHDSAFRPHLDDALPRRWLPEDSSNGWREAVDGYELEERAADDSSNDWLLYHHWPCMPSNAPRVKRSPIKDHYGYNQGLARKLSSVHDVILECRWALGQWNRLVVSIANDGGRLEVELTRETNTAVLRSDGKRVGAAKLPPAISAKETTLEFAVFDQQAILAIDRHELIVVDITSDHRRSPIPLNGVRIGASGGRIHLKRVRLLRDIHYQRPQGASWTLPTEWQLGKDEYFVVGDNIPISHDSRMWKTPGVQRNMFLGRVLARQE